MTPREFVEKWRGAELKESAASQVHFTDLCHLLGVPDPIEADPKGEWFTFEKGVSRATGGAGWADVWRKGCFGWEYKGKRANLDAALKQLLNYSAALDNPPLLIVSDMETIRIHTNWTNTVQQVHTITLVDLLDGAKRDILQAAFTDPERLRPAKTRQTLTEEAAEKFATLAQRLRDRGYGADAVAHFVNRLVFCMFAEDVNLLPERMFSRMLERSVAAPGDFQENARALFDAMKDGGPVGFERVEWFNGGLFDSDEALPLEKPDIAEVLVTAKMDWSDIDPSILGTLFERGLDPAKRSQLGAHYTDRDKIMAVVDPVIVRPLAAEWEGVKAEIEAANHKAAEARSKGARTKAQNAASLLHAGFIERLRGFRVLDPACGSGNFLYLSLLALKDLEHKANLDAEALGLKRGFPTVGPECVRGLEINTYAAELARISVWIGEIQWMRRNGFEAARNPILRPLETIECRDALLTDGARADWPEADVVVGNPPFLGGKRMRDELGDEYVDALFAVWREDVRPEADLVLYWFAQSARMMRQGGLARAGLVATNSIRGGANRATLQHALGDHGRIFDAWADEPWVVEGAAVRVSILSFDFGGGGGVRLDGAPVAEIHSDLTASAIGARSVDLTQAGRLRRNAGVAFMGSTKVGPFDIPGEVARDWLAAPLNPNGRPNADVLRPWTNGTGIVQRDPDRWIIDYGCTMPETDAALYAAPFAHVVAHVKPMRDRSRRDGYRTKWWLHGEPRPGLRAAVESLSRTIVTPRVSKHRVFVWRHNRVLPDSAVIAIARDDDTAFGILHSRFHELWSLRMGTALEDRPRYTPSTTFETFPFPDGLTPDIPAAEYADDPRARNIAEAAARLNELRENWLNPPDLVRREPETAEGYPDRILPLDAAAEAVLKKRTLTRLYNERPAWLDHAHAALDEAVAEAYGWGDDWRAGKLDEDEILARLFDLNQAG